MNVSSNEITRGRRWSRAIALCIAALCCTAAATWIVRRSVEDADHRLLSAVPVGSVQPDRAASDQTATSPTASRVALPTVPGLTRQRQGVVLGSVTRLASPASDADWDSERISKEVEARLAELAGTVHNGFPDRDRLGEFVTDRLSFSCSPLRPELSEVFNDGPITVLRPADIGSAAGSTQYNGLEGFCEAFESLLEPFRGAGEVRFAFKVVGIQLGAEITTDVLVETAGLTSATALQQSAQWRCRWTRESDASPLRLVSLDSHQFEESRLALSGSRVFTDRTSVAVENGSALRDQLQPGMAHWHQHLELAFGFDHGMQGLAVGDVNGDGLDDVYVCQPAGLVNRLLVRDAAGRLRDQTNASGADWLDVSRAALLIDLDNDADQDLVISVSHRVAVHANDGRGRFTLVTAIPTRSDLYSLCAADYDNDGDLDIFACGYTRQGQLAVGDSFADPAPYHDANNGGPNLLLRNEGRFVLVDVTRESGMDQNNRRFSYAAAWEDYDNDGDVDLYVANDFGRNNLYRNDGGRFVDVAAREAVEDIGAGMSVAWGDVDHNGLMDLYVGNMFSSAGSRVTSQKRFQDRFDAVENAQLRRHARGNSLFCRTADGRFRDCSHEARVAAGRWAWGSTFVDINNDGWEDLFVANGFFTSEDTVDL